MSRSSRIRIAAAATAFALPLSSALAMDMTASATIVGTCQMVTTAPLSFGNLDQVAAPAVPKTSTATYKCTSGITPTFKVGGQDDGTAGYTGALDNGTDTIAYTVKWAAVGAATGFSTPVSVTLNGNIPASTYQDKSAGTYTETVAITVTP